ncbi:type II secretion system protein [Patescibacteria group bacterium]|jgi:prepilin-type N-terminal cleavage/methylation domain-containing protein|nr:type II secretion system protein [Patescibacteria group bacterium]
MLKRLRSGFTILEALVVILVVGILASIAVYSLSVTRASNRDAKRISDVSVIRAALTQHWLQKASYPSTEAVDLGRPGGGAERLTASGFVASDSSTSPVFLEVVPIGPRSGEYYRYHGAASGYSLQFRTERATAYGPPGVYYAHTDGVDQEDVEK